MPKPVKQRTKKRPNRPTDVNQWARQLVDESTAEPKPAAPAISKDALSAYMAKLGKKGGKVGGKRRLETMTPDQRSQVAFKAAMKRWDKKRKP